jgi:ATP-dependent helicase/nuclease subunit A
LIPDRVRPYLAPRSRLAQIIARQIHSWCFVERREIPSRGRVMQPGDVLVLVRTRGSFVPELVKACKQLGLPVAGVDRMKLTEQLAVEDLLALLDVLLLPEDDLALATVLKGPLCALTEEASVYAGAQPRRRKPVAPAAIPRQNRAAVGRTDRLSARADVGSSTA